MTRETKIGLLVGLAFIIVIGILLSDHMTSTTEPPKAPLSVAGGNVRESVVTPAAPGGAATASPHAAAVGVGGVPSGVVPNQPVLTGPELAQPQRTNTGPIQAGQSPLVVQPPPAGQQVPAQSLPQPQIPVQVSPGVAQGGQGSQPAQQTIAGQPPVIDDPVTRVPPTAQPRPTHPLQQLAQRHGEELIGVGGAGNTSNAPPPTVRPQPVPMGAMREYKAQSGDSLSKLAVKFLGSNSKANRDAIIRLNPTLQQNPDRIVEGRTYVLPPPPVQAVAEATATGGHNAAPAGARSETGPDAPPQRRAEAPAGDNFTWYTVKENENLWKIASEQLGSGNAWQQIRDLNQDILKGEDQVRANTRIRLPNKPVASAH